MNPAIPKSAVSPDDGQWYRAEAFIPGSADEVSEKVMAAAKYTGLSVRGRNGSTIVCRLRRRWPTSPRVDLRVSFIARSGGTVVLVTGQARRMNRTANAAYARKVVDAFLINAQKTEWRMAGNMEQLRFAVWGLVGLTVVVVDVVRWAFGTWLYVLTCAWWIVLVGATDLSLRRWTGTDSRRDRLSTSILGAIAICATLAYVLI